MAFDESRCESLHQYLEIVGFGDARGFSVPNLISPFDTGGDDGVVEVFFSLEVSEDDRLGHTSGGSDGACRSAFEPFGGEKVHRDLDDLIAALSAG